MHIKGLSPSKDTKINIRIDPRSLDLIDQAAKAKGKNRSSYMVDLALQAAEEELLNQTNFFLNEEVWAAFNTLLDKKSKSKNAKLQKLMEQKNLWKS